MASTGANHDAIGNFSLLHFLAGQLLRQFDEQRFAEFQQAGEGEYDESHLRRMDYYRAVRKERVNSYTRQLRGELKQLLKLDQIPNLLDLSRNLPSELKEFANLFDRLTPEELAAEERLEKRRKRLDNSSEIKGHERDGFRAHMQLKNILDEVCFVPFSPATFSFTLRLISTLLIASRWFQSFAQTAAHWQKHWGSCGPKEVNPKRTSSLYVLVHWLSSVMASWYRTWLAPTTPSILQTLTID